jgi:hypothetical protein
MSTPVQDIQALIGCVTDIVNPDAYRVLREETVDLLKSHRHALWDGCYWNTAGIAVNEAAEWFFAAYLSACRRGVDSDTTKIESGRAVQYLHRAILDLESV